MGWRTAGAEPRGLDSAPFLHRDLEGANFGERNCRISETELQRSIGANNDDRCQFD
jgi:hypothetical protein